MDPIKEIEHKESGEINYLGRDLEVMVSAPNYAKWICESISPYIGKKVLEIGAGRGTISAILLSETNCQLIALEPSRKMFDILSNTIKDYLDNNRADAIQGSLCEVSSKLCDKGIDTVIYVNVLEHIDKDSHEINMAKELLVEGGNIAIFSPALPSLYGRFDRNVGHYRRYRLSQLISLVENAGLKVVEARYTDIIGMILWWIKYRLFGSSGLELRSVVIFDKLIVPINRAIEKMLRVPIGKNVFVIARKI